LDPQDFGFLDLDPTGKLNTKKTQKFNGNNLDPDPNEFFSSADPGSGTASKLNGT